MHERLGAPGNRHDEADVEHHAEKQANSSHRVSSPAALRAAFEARARHACEPTRTQTAGPAVPSELPRTISLRRARGRIDDGASATAPWSKASGYAAHTGAFA